VFDLETHSCNELRTRSHLYALQNFEEVVKTEEFLFLSFSEVIDLLFLLRFLFMYREDINNTLLGLLRWTPKVVDVQRSFAGWAGGLSPQTDWGRNLQWVGETSQTWVKDDMAYIYGVTDRRWQVLDSA